MFGKIQILCLMVFCCSITNVKAQQNNENVALPRLVIDNCYFVTTDHEQLILSVYIVNDSYTNLKYWDTSGQLGELFALAGDLDLQLINSADTASANQVVLAPRSSHHYNLIFIANPRLEGMHQFKVMMKFHPCYVNSDYVHDRIYHAAKILTDSIKVTFDGLIGGSYLSQTEWVERKKLTLPSTSLAEANSLSNQTDTVTVDEREITKMFVYTLNWHLLKLRGWSGNPDSKKESCSVVPVTLHNYSDNPLYYNSMSCTWEDDYQVNNKKISILLRSCTKNIPVTIEVPPHSTRTQSIVIVSAKDNLNQTETTKIELKAGGGHWSNEVQLNTD